MICLCKIRNRRFKTPNFCFSDTLVLLTAALIFFSASEAGDMNGILRKVRLGGKYVRGSHFFEKQPIVLTLDRFEYSG